MGTCIWYMYMYMYMYVSTTIQEMCSNWYYSWVLVNDGYLYSRVYMYVFLRGKKLTGTNVTVHESPSHRRESFQSTGSHSVLSDWVILSGESLYPLSLAP